MAGNEFRAMTEEEIRTMVKELRPDITDETFTELYPSLPAFFANDDSLRAKEIFLKSKLEVLSPRLISGSAATSQETKAASSKVPVPPVPTPVTNPVPTNPAPDASSSGTDPKAPVEEKKFTQSSAAQSSSLVKSPEPEDGSMVLGEAADLIDKNMLDEVFPGCTWKHVQTREGTRIVIFPEGSNPSEKKVEEKTDKTGKKQKVKAGRVQVLPTPANPQLSTPAGRDPSLQAKVSSNTEQNFSFTTSKDKQVTATIPRGELQKLKEGFRQAFAIAKALKERGKIQETKIDVDSITALNLPQANLNDLVRFILKESETTGVPINNEDEKRLKGLIKSLEEKAKKAPPAPKPPVEQKKPLRKTPPRRKTSMPEMTPEFVTVRDRMLKSRKLNANGDPTAVTDKKGNRVRLGEIEDEKTEDEKEISIRMQKLNEAKKREQEQQKSFAEAKSVAEKIAAFDKIIRVQMADAVQKSKQAADLEGKAAAVAERSVTKPLGLNQRQQQRQEKTQEVKES